MENNQWSNNNQQSSQCYGQQSNLGGQAQQNSQEFSTQQGGQGFNQYGQGYGQQNNMGGQMGYGEQQSYNNQGPLGQQVDLQNQYNQQMHNQHGYVPKKKGKGCLIALIVSILAAVLLVVGLFMAGNFVAGLFKGWTDYEDTEYIEEDYTYEADWDVTVEVPAETEGLGGTEATETSETSEGSTETPVNPDEIVQNKVPTEDEMKELWRSIGFNVFGSVITIEDGLDADYKTYDTPMAAEITYSSYIDTVFEEIKTQHTNEKSHDSWTVTIDDADYGDYRVFQFISERHDENCELRLNNFIENEIDVKQYILYGNSVLIYTYTVTYEGNTTADAKAFLKALELNEYPTAAMYEVVNTEVEASAETDVITE